MRNEGLMFGGGKGVVGVLRNFGIHFYSSSSLVAAKARRAAGETVDGVYKATLKAYRNHQPIEAYI